MPWVFPYGGQQGFQITGALSGGHEKISDLTKTRLPKDNSK